MDLSSYFNDMLSEIRPTQTQRKNLQDAHRRLRERLESDEHLNPKIVSVFLQGSYRRSTATRPQGDDKLDVDMVVVTRLPHEKYLNPEDAMDEFVPFLEKHYKGKWEKKGRSFGIEMSDVKIDLVVASAPSEEDAFASEFLQGYLTLDDLFAGQTRNTEGIQSLFDASGDGAQWKAEPLFIPDRDARQWQRTHPLEQIRWTTEKNQRTNGHYVNVVRLVKWWWRSKYPELKYPKGYPLEHMVGDCCPNDVTSIAEGFSLTLEEMHRRFNTYALTGRVPFLSDRGVPEHNVLKRLTAREFAAFNQKIGEAAKTARDAYEEKDVAKSAALWRDLFGSKFPSPPSSGSSGTAAGAATGGFTQRTKPTQIGGGRFA